MSLINELHRMSPMALRLLAIKFISYLGIIPSYYIGILGTLTYGAKGDALASTIAVGLMNLFMIVGVFAGGMVVDRMGPRRHLSFAMGCAIAASVAFTLLSGSIPGILVGASFVGLAWGVEDPIFRAYPAYLTDNMNELKVINAALNAAISIGVVTGPLIGSAISLVAPTWATFFFTIALSLVALVIGSEFVPVRDPHVQAPMGKGGATKANSKATKKKNSALAGFKTVVASPTLRLLVIAGFLAFFAYGAFDPLESLYYRDVLQVGAEWMGVLSSASGFGAFFGGLLVIRIPAPHVNLRTFLICLAIEGIGCILYVGTGSVYVALIGQVLLGAANGAFNPLQTTLLQVHAPLSEVGRVAAAVGFVYQASGVLPLMLAPTLAAVLGVQGTLVASGICVAVIPSILMVVLRRRIKASVEEERAHNIRVEE